MMVKKQRRYGYDRRHETVSYERQPCGERVLPIFNIKKWKVPKKEFVDGNEQIMKRVCDANADGMTVNFPDKLMAYIREKS